LSVRRRIIGEGRQLFCFLFPGKLSKKVLTSEVLMMVLFSELDLSDNINLK